MSALIGLKRQSPLHDITNKRNAGHKRDVSVGILTPESSPIRPKKRKVAVVNQKSSFTAFAARRLLGSFGGTAAAYYSSRCSYQEERYRAETFVNPPQYRYRSWQEANIDTGDPYCMIGDKERVIIGTDGGQVTYLETPDLDNGDRSWTCKLLDNLGEEAISTVALSKSHKWLAAVQKGDKVSILSLDGARESSKFGHDSMKFGPIRQTRFRPGEETTLAVSTRLGNIMLYDAREQHSLQVTGFKKNGHMNKSTAKIRGRNEMGITAMEWINEYTICTGGESELPLKFWDVRKFSAKGSLRTDPVFTTPEVTDGVASKGVSSIVVDKTADRVWALSLDSKIRSYSIACPSFKVMDTLTHPQLVGLDFHSNIALLHPHRHKNRSGTPLLACSGGTSGPILFALSRNIQDKSTQGICLYDSNDLACTGVATDSNGVLYSVAADLSVSAWYEDAGKYSNLVNEYRNDWEVPDRRYAWSMSRAMGH